MENPTSRLIFLVWSCWILTVSQTFLTGSWICTQNIVYQSLLILSCCLENSLIYRKLFLLCLRICNFYKLLNSCDTFLISTYKIYGPVLYIRILMMSFRILYFFFCFLKKTDPVTLCLQQRDAETINYDLCEHKFSLNSFELEIFQLFNFVRKWMELTFITNSVW